MCLMARFNEHWYHCPYYVRAENFLTNSVILYHAIGYDFITLLGKGFLQILFAFHFMEQ